MAAQRAVVIYDGACPMCVAARAWIERRAMPGALEFVPCQSPERARRFPAIPERACLEAMQLVLPEGRVLSGPSALPEVLRRLRRWRWLAGALALPGVARLAPRGYAWVARRRYALSRLLPHGPGGGADPPAPP